MFFESVQIMRNKFVWFIFAVFRVLIYYCVFVSSQIIVLLAFELLRINYDIYNGTFLLLSSIIAIPLMLLCVLVEKKISMLEKYNNIICDDKWCDGRTVKLKKLSTEDTLFAIIIAFGLLGIVTLYFVLFDFIKELFNSKAVENAISDYNQTMDRYSVVEQDLVPFWDNLLNYFNMVFLVPIAEELMFRGLLFGTIKRRMPFWVAVLISSLIFGIGHFQLMQIGYALIAGVVLSMTYYYTDSLFASIMVHGIFNLIGGTISAIPSDFPGASNVVNAILDGTTTAELCAIIPSIAILCLLVKRGRQNFTIHDMIEKESD